MDSKKITEYKNQQIFKKYKKLKWSRKESHIRIRPKYRLQPLIENNVPISLIIKERLRKSCLGRFLKSFNEDQNQNNFLNINKLGLEEWNIEKHDNEEARDWAYYNDIMDDIISFLKTAIAKSDCIDFDYLYENLRALRLQDSQINEIDSIRKYLNLEILILSGNWIKNIPGKKLPRNLRYLECYVNEISDVEDFCDRSPRRMKHLGFARNQITNDSKCHLFASSGRFTELQTLDLANNNIMDLSCILEELRYLPRLVGLTLEGNPCYTCETYKEKILSVIPRLVYLDETEILNEDRCYTDCDLEEGLKNSALIFTCYRLLGIPAPPSGSKDIVHTFHLEIELPLMEEIIIPDYLKPKPKIIKEPTPPPPPPPSKKKGKDTEKGKEKKNNKSERSTVKLPKPAKGKGYYSLPDENQQEVLLNIKNTNFMTEPREWQPIMKFNCPAITIPTPENKFELLRNTFRSRVIVKVIYLQKFIQKTKKKPPAPEDIFILKKSTIAKFYCDLKTVNWSDPYVDYIWSDFPRVGKAAIPVTGSLKPELYLEPGKKEGKKSDPILKIPAPTKLTCHIGFGIKRYGQIPEIIVSKKKKK